MKKTKIVSTLGPASNDLDTIVKLIEAGANVFRFNFSHGDHEEHLGRLNLVHEAEKKTGKTVGILLDTKGAEIRTTVQKDGKIEFHIGDEVRISMDDSIEGTKEKIAVTYPGLYDDVHEGGHVLFDDGLIDMQIEKKDDANRELVCKVLNEGVLGSRKGVNAPGVSINLPGITEKDSSDIRFGLDHEINYIAASFVRKPQDILDIRELLEEKHMEHVQKSLIKKCNAVGKPVITATQMLDSMIENPRPTRAEASDVANAVFDGTDATMLSGESANGDYPVEAVATMARIDVKAENALRQYKNFSINDFDKTDVTEAIGRAAAEAVENLGIKTIVAATESGYTAKMISKYRPDADILAVTFDDRTRRGLMVNWGVYPVVAEKPATTDEMFKLATEEAKKAGLAKEGDLILIVAGVPVGEKGTTNIMKIQLVGSALVKGQGVGEETVIGKAVIAKSADEANKKAEEGCVLVTKTTDKDYLPAIEKASALVVENGGLTSHAAVVGISMGIPVVVGAENATDAIKEGETVTVDSRRGSIYRGASSTL